MAKADAKPAAQKSPAPKGGAAKTPPKGQPRKGDKPAAAPAETARPRSTGDVPARMKEHFFKTVVPAMM
jgi:hypothetical protein